MNVLTYLQESSSNSESTDNASSAIPGHDYFSYENANYDSNASTPRSSCSTGSEYPFPTKNPNLSKLTLCCPGCGNTLKWIMLGITSKPYYNVHTFQAQCSCERYKSGFFEGPVEALYVPKGIY